MTVKEVAKMAYDLSLGHYINGEKYKSSAEFYRTLTHWMQSGDQYIAELCFPDGRWLCKFYKVPKIKNCYDLFIPDTREQEQTLYMQIV